MNNEKDSPAPTSPDYRLYESLKAQYLRQRPDATPAEYAHALQVIAKECGV